MSAAMVVIMIGRNRSQCSFVDRLLSALARGALPVEGQVNHHDGVLLDDAHQHDDADESVKTQVYMKQKQGEQGTEVQPRASQTRW